MLPIALIVIVTGLVPMIIYATILWWIDHWEREPWYLIAAAFVWGGIPAIILALISQTVIRGVVSANVFHDPIQQLWYMAVFAAPITEEAIKAFALLLIFLFLRKHIDSLLDGLIYGAAVGFGFAAVENVFYFAEAAFWFGAPPLGYIFLRAFAFGLNHALFTGMTGLGFGLARFRKSRSAHVFFPLAGLTVAMLLHGTLNFMAVQAFLDDSTALFRALVLSGFGAFWVIVLIFTSLFVQGWWVRHHLQEEVELGVLTPFQAQTACSTIASLTMRGEQRRLNQLCAKLAMKKHAFARLGEAGQSLAEIEAIRRQVAELASRLGSATVRERVLHEMEPCQRA